VYLKRCNPILNNGACVLVPCIPEFVHGGRNIGDVERRIVASKGPGSALWTSSNGKIELACAGGIRWNVKRDFRPDLKEECEGDVDVRRLVMKR
jgi:hypothetical protein